MTTVNSGVIIPATPAITEPGVPMPIKPGSAITAAGLANAEKTSIQAEAVKNLGGKIGGRRRVVKKGKVALDKSSLLLKNILQITDITTTYNH